MRIPFNRPFRALRENEYVLEALQSGRLSGNNQFAKRVQQHIWDRHKLENVFLVPSGTAALEMGAWLAGLGPGDEVILPSYTFSSTANAVVMTGAKPVFCEVDPKTMNANVDHMESLITERTKMLLPIDYAGIPCAIDRIGELARKHGLLVMVDAAQSYGTYHEGKACGSFGDLATFSFHETKNISCGEGGALVVNRPDWVERANFLQEKGTDRSLVLFGQKSKYHWVDIGSSYLLSDILAAVLLAQLEEEDAILKLRGKVTSAYTDLLKPFATAGSISIAPYDLYKNLNSHAFWVVFDKEENKESFLLGMKEKDAYAYIGYIPLHSAPMGIKLGNRAGNLPTTEDLATRIVRLPLYADLAREGLPQLLDTMQNVLRNIYG